MLSSRAIPDAGGPVERPVTSDTVDWFPDISPDSQSAAYIAFPCGETWASGRS